MPLLIKLKDKELFILRNFKDDKYFKLLDLNKDKLTIF